MSGRRIGAGPHPGVANTGAHVATHCGSALTAQICRMAAHRVEELMFTPSRRNPSRV
jgi:hypothetical protein